MNMFLTTSAFIFPLITFPYISRVLLPAGNGKIAFANSIITYFSMFALLGTPIYGIRACAQVRDDKILLSKTVQEIALINLFTTVAAYLFLGTALLCIPRLKEERMLFMVCSSTLFLNLISMEWLYKALEQYTYITIRSLSFKILSVLLMFLMVRSKEDYIIYAGISVLANAGYGVLNFFCLWRYINLEHFEKYEIKKHIKPILIFFAMSVAVTIYTNLDITMLGFLKGDTEVGYYDMAIKIKVILVNMVTSLGAVLLPRTSYYIEKKMKREFEVVSAKALEFVAVLSVPLTVSFIITAERCILLLSGAAYLPSVLPMRIIMPTVCLIGASNVFGIQMLVPLGGEKYVLYSEITGALVDIVLNSILIPAYGAVGAAFGTLIAEIAVLIIQICVLKRYAMQAIKKLQMLKIILATLAASIVLTYLYLNLAVSPILNLIVSFTAFFIIYFLILLFMKERLVSEISNYIFGKIRKRSLN